MSILDLFAREDERPFLMRAANGELSDEARQLYAKRLAAGDPERAEWLRLEVALHAGPSLDAAVRARFDHLCEVCNHDWVALLRRDMVLNCGAAAGETARVRFQRVCDRQWESLEPTDSPGVRHCADCRQRVYFSTSAAEAEAHALAGHCIAVPRSLRDGGVDLDTRHMLGRPDPVGNWAERLFPKTTSM